MVSFEKVFVNLCLLGFFFLQDLEAENEGTFHFWRLNSPVDLPISHGEDCTSVQRIGRILEMKMLLPGFFHNMSS
jgi:hypothetical protein